VHWYYFYSNITILLLWYLSWHFWFVYDMRVNEKIYKISEKFDRETSQRLIIDLFNKPFENHQRTHTVECNDIMLLALYSDIFTCNNDMVCRWSPVVCSQLELTLKWGCIWLFHSRIDTIFLENNTKAEKYFLSTVKLSSYCPSRPLSPLLLLLLLEIISPLFVKYIY